MKQKIDKILSRILEDSKAQPSHLLTQYFTFKADDYLLSLTRQDKKNVALQLLLCDVGPYPYNSNIDLSIVEHIKDSLLSILRKSVGQTDTLFSKDFTYKADDYLHTLKGNDKAVAVQLLESKSGPFPYFHDTYDYSLTGFNEHGICQHGLTADTCPCGCDLIGETFEH